MTKNELRLIDKKLRKEIKNKNELDNIIYDNLKAFLATISYDKILCYFPVSGEISILDKLLADYVKIAKIALPKSNSSDLSMSFYCISSLLDLEPGLYNIKEPKTTLELLDDYNNSVCIVPGISFDKKGYRIGYGKGYYDRFLKNYPGIKIGLTYSTLLHDEIPHDDNDIKLDFIISEGGLVKTLEN